MKKLLMFAFLIILSLAFVNNVFAEDLNYSVSVESALNITTSSNKISLNLNPLTHDFDSQDLNILVSTNNETGYRLYVNTTGTDLVEKNDSSLIIETLENEVPESDFTLNRWGYKLNSENFLPFSSGTLISSSKNAVENDSSALTFAAKVDYETKAGSYALTLNFQATANPLAKTIADAEYMQEVSSKEIGGCPADLETGQVYQLKDSRDNEVYNIARLADGNCWMLDNLRLKTTTVGLTDENSNVPYTSANAWYLPGSTGSINSSDVKQINSSYVDTLVTNYGVGAGKIGVYYNYCAATAGTYCYPSGSGHGDAQYDVCPAGWRLPTGGNGGEYQTAYGVYDNSVADFEKALSISLSGIYQNSSALLRNSGASSWSSTEYIGANNYMHTLDSYASSVCVETCGGSRALGVSIRCVLK